MNPMAERILTGESVCRSEINEFNAAQLVAWISDTDRHHTKDACPNGKDCVHKPEAMTAAWAVTLSNQARVVCSCGAHGVSDPVEADRIIAEFRSEWGQDNARPPKVKGRR
jgi:hypothetical protein